MSSRLIRSAIGARSLRPSIIPRTLPTTSLTLTPARLASNVPSEDPSKKAQSIVDSLPGNSLVSKTAILSAGTGLATWAISAEIFVYNEESIVAFCTLCMFWGVYQYGGPYYTEWALKHINKQKEVLYAAKEGHKTAVRNRIEDVKRLGSVVEVTKQLFEVSKETARLEAEAFELEQKTALAAETKSVLDSWVRYEGQVKQREQKELAESIIAKITKELENPKNLQQILNQSVADVEKIVSTKPQ
ncbi:MAG: hypothetical protein LQ348_005507 [Seirophora lacunosa]|nr:MAG: hypothetical protein LQ344_007603 [Seirophora lacunosa]KAI4178889.1 MAG: hypothetical protein LQ348_005507 [Seirophora lacunosa]